jgi:uncharacterized membrane protein YqgA involved in biofilm formation
MLLGTIVNAVAILLGTLLGRLIPNMNVMMQRTVLQGLGLAVVGLGLQMTFKANDFLVIIISIVIGGVAGELLKLEDRLNGVGRWIEYQVDQKLGKRKDEKDKNSVATAFVTATLVYCIGAMAVVGSMDSGLRNDHTVLFTKSLLDGFSAIIFSSTLGFGVAFSAIAVFIYQSLMVIGSSFIVDVIGVSMVDRVVAAITGTGGLLIMAIGLNVMEIAKIRVANLIPALMAAVLIVVAKQWVNTYIQWL